MPGGQNYVNGAEKFSGIGLNRFIGLLLTTRIYIELQTGAGKSNP